MDWGSRGIIFQLDRVEWELILFGTEAVAERSVCQALKPNQSNVIGKERMLRVMRQKGWFVELNKNANFSCKITVNFVEEHGLVFYGLS